MVKFMNTMTKVLFPFGLGQMLQRFSIFYLIMPILNVDMHLQVQTNS